MSADVALSAGTWSVDVGATTATFTARNFGARRVQGRFAVLRGTVEVDAAGRPIGITGTVDAGTVDTGNRRRDGDLRSRRFLDVAGRPELVLRCREIEEADGGWTLHGSLDVRGADAPLVLRVRPEPPVEPSSDAEPERAGTRRVVATGTLDLRTTPIRAPRILVGRYVDVRIDATLRPGPGLP
jgi:polyisoprenoid-binding protein YceI